MTNTEEETPTVSNDYKISMKKYLSNDGENVIYDLSLNENLTKLLSLACVKTEELSNLGNDLSQCSGKRYKIKSVVRNSGYFKTWYLALFSKKLIDGDEPVSVKFNNVRNGKDFEQYFTGSYLKEFIMDINEILSYTTPKEIDIILRPQLETGQPLQVVTE